ncbi:MAG: hypothetical protein OXC40_02965 [Proteobacteria bacterium]|nr:hypothetical protein [Pseudomonadota bacterium]
MTMYNKTLVLATTLLLAYPTGVLAQSVGPFYEPQQEAVEAEADPNSTQENTPDPQETTPVATPQVNQRPPIAPQQEEDDSGESNFLEDIFDPVPLPVYEQPTDSSVTPVDPDTMRNTVEAEPSGEDVDIPNSMSLDGDSTQNFSFKVTLEPLRNLKTHNVKIVLKSLDNEPADKLRIAFLSSTSVLATDSDGVFLLKDVPENSDLLFKTFDNNQIYKTMTHEITALSFREQSELNNSDDNTAVSNRIQIKTAEFNNWLNTLDIQEEQGTGHVCGEISSTVQDSPAGFRVNFSYIQNNVLTNPEDVRTYYFDETLMPNPDLEATSQAGRYCIFNIDSSAIKLRIDHIRNNYIHSLTHRTTVKADEVSYIFTDDSPGKIGLIRHLAAPDPEQLFDDNLAKPRSYHITADPGIASPASGSYFDVDESFYQGIDQQEELTALIETENENTSTGSTIIDKGKLIESIKIFLGSWWDRVSRSSLLPQQATVLPQVYSQEPGQKIHVAVHSPLWEKSFYRLRETHWYGYYPIILLPKDSIAKIAELAGESYEEQAGHIFVEHSFYSEEVDIPLVQELWHEDGSLLVAKVVKRNNVSFRALYLNLDDSRYLWILKTIDGKWLSSQVVNTYGGHTTVIQSGRQYQFGLLSPFGNKLPDLSLSDIDLPRDNSPDSQLILP